VIIRRLCLSLLACAASAYAPAQGLDQPVTANYPAQPLGRLIPALAKQTGIDLRISRSAEGDVAMVRVKDVPLNKVMQKIAAVTGRIWEQKDGQYMLTSSVAADRAGERRVLKRRAEIIRQALAKLAGDPVYRQRFGQPEAIALANKTETVMNPKDGHLDRTKIDFGELRGRAPTDRALAALLAIMDPAELAQSWSSKRVYATKPTAMQFALPNRAQGIFEQLLREQSMFVDATNDFKDRLGPQDSSFSTSEISRGEFGKGNPKLGVGKGIVKIEGSEAGPFLTASLILTDAAGHLLIEGNLSLPIDPVVPTKFQPKDREASVAADSRVKEMGLTEPFEGAMGTRMSMVTSDGTDTVRLDVPNNPPQRKTPLSAELKQLLLAPNVTDPLSLCAGKLLEAAAEVRGENLVACIDDGLFTTSVDHLIKGMKPTDFLNSPDFQQYQEVDISEGWITIQPKDFAAAQKRRTNRDALAKLMQSIDRNKLLLLNDLCEFAQTQEEPAGSQKIDLTYMRLLNPGVINGAYDPFKWYVYKFFGSLTPEQKKILGSGAGVPVQNLTPSARKALTQYIFVAYVQPQLKKADGTAIDPWSEGVVTEWTQLLPNGLLDGAMISAKVKQEDAAYCVDSSLGSAQIVSAESLATLQFIGETPGLKGGAPKFDRFSPTTQWTYSFNIALAPGVFINTDLTDGAISGAPTNLDIKSLPAAFQAAYALRLEKLKKFYGQRDFTNDGSGDPP